MSATERFEYGFDHRYSPLFKLLGVSPADAVEVDDTRLRATYGRVSLETPLDNIDRTEVTGPHRWYTAVGLRLSFADDGVTFGTNYRSGLCICFTTRVRRVVGFRDHSSLWVSVADPEGLAAAIERHRRPDDDR